MNQTDESPLDETLVPAPEPVPAADPDIGPDADPPVDPDAPCPFFPAFANGILNWCGRRVANTRRRAGKLPSVLAAPILTILSYLGFFLGAILLHAPAVVGVGLGVLSFLYMEFLPDEARTILWVGLSLAGIAIQVFLLIRVTLKVRTAADRGEVRVFNSYFELVGNALLVLFITFFGVIMFLYCFMEPSAEKLSSLAMLFIFLEGVSAVALALLVHSCYVRNRHLGWKTAFAVVVAKYVASWFAYFCVMRIWTAIDRILHPVDPIEAAENRWHDRHTMNENAKRGRTETTNVVAEFIVAAAVAWILKKTIAPLVTGRPEDEPNGFSAAMRDFRKWLAGRGTFFVGAVVSFVLLCVGLAFASLALERREAKTIKAEQAEMQQEQEVTANMREHLDKLGSVLRSRIPDDAIPGAGEFSSADDYFKALSKKGAFRDLPRAVAEAFVPEYANRMEAKRDFYSRAFEESGLFAEEGGELPPVLRIWTVLAGGTKDEFGVPFFWMSNLRVSPDKLPARPKDKWATIDPKVPIAVVARRDGPGVSAEIGVPGAADAFGGVGPNGGFQVLEPTAAFDREVVMRFLEAVASAEESVLRSNERVEECDAVQRSLQGGAGSADGGNKPACPLGGEIRLEPIPESAAFREWDPSAPLFYRTKCSIHGPSEFPGNDTEAERLLDYCRQFAGNGTTELAKAARDVLSPRRIGEFVSVKPVPQPERAVNWSVDPYSEETKVDWLLRIDTVSYRDWADRVVEALKPYAVETVRGKARIETGPTARMHYADKSVILFDKPAQGNPLHVVLDPKTLETTTLLFKNSDWDVLRKAVPEIRFAVSGGLSGADGKSESKRGSAAYRGVLVLSCNAIVPFFTNGSGSYGDDRSNTGDPEARIRNSFQWRKESRPAEIARGWLAVDAKSYAPAWTPKDADRVPSIPASARFFEEKSPDPDPEPEPESKPEPEPESKPEPKPETEVSPDRSASATPAPPPAKKTTLTDLADRQAAAYREKEKTAEQILKWTKSPKFSEPQRKRLRELLEDRGVPLAETERKATEEAKRKKAEEARRKAAEEARRKAAEEAKRRQAEAEFKAAREAAERRRLEEERRANELKLQREQAEAARKRQEQLEQIQRMTRSCLPMPYFVGF